MTPDPEQAPSSTIIEASGTPPFQHMPFRLDAIRSWRAAQALQGEPASLRDFFRSHGCCFTCLGARQRCVFRKGAWHISRCPRCGGSGRYTESTQEEQHFPVKRFSPR